jgi:cytochrome b6-f complex iron-sulfur subunit
MSNPVKSASLAQVGCSRRAVLQGLGAAAVGAMLINCVQQGSSLPTATATAVGNSMAIDLAVAANADLLAVGGAMLVDSAHDTIMVIRTSDTSVIALSAICTHAGCSMDYAASSHRLDCPCHGSQFNEQGQVVVGPARTPLKIYTATLANNVITVAA